MPEITQKLGFDAADAIRSVNAMEKSLSALNSTLKTFSKAANVSPRNVIDGMEKLDTKAKGAAKSVANVGKVAKKSNKAAADSVQKVTLSYQAFAKVLSVQGIVRSLNFLKDVFSKIAEEYRSFEETMARTAQIVSGPGSSVDNLTDKIGKLAAAMGRSLESVQTAAWDAFQNDIGTVAETFDFLSQSHKLAMVTGAELGESMNTLTSVMKAYGLSSKDVTGVTDALYVAIDKGRISLSELETKMGQVLPASAALGLSVQETLGSIAAMTQAGLKGAGAMTQYRNILNKFISPTTKLKEAFIALGVQSGPELIKKFGGLFPALRELKRLVNDDDIALADMFGTLRGKMGVLNLMAGDGRILNDVMAAMEKAAGKTARAVDAISATSSHRLKLATEELNLALRSTGGIFTNLEIFSKRFYLNSIKLTDQYIAAIDKLSENRTAQSVRQYKDGLQQEIAASREALKAKVADAKTLAEASKIDSSLVAGEMLRVVDAVNAAYSDASVNVAKYGVNAAFAADSIQRLADLQNQLASEVASKGNVIFSGMDEQARNDMAAMMQKLTRYQQSAISSKKTELGQLKQLTDLEARKLEKEILAGNVTDKVADTMRGQVTTLRDLFSQRETELRMTEGLAKWVKRVAEIDATRPELLRKIVSESNNMTTSAENTKNAIVAGSDALDRISTNTGVSEMGRLEAAAKKAAVAVAAAATAASSGGGNKYHGGKIGYRATGGRGLDTQLTATSPGEFIMNARSSRQFFSELQAMNSGQTPQRREHGGSVSQTFGDINVNVQDAVAPANTVRAIGVGLEREIRRRTVSL